MNYRAIKINNNEWKEIIENAVSWIVVFAMLIYGGGKLIQFKGAAETSKAVSEMSGMELMWAFYGYSYTFALTLGALEIIGGLLILIKPTRLIGCLFTSTILVNIIMQDIFFGVNEGALRAAIFYQLMILLVLWMNKDTLIQSIKNLLIPFNRVDTVTKFLLKLLIAFVLFALIRILEYYLTTMQIYSH